MARVMLLYSIVIQLHPKWIFIKKCSTFKIIWHVLCYWTALWCNYRQSEFSLRNAVRSKAYGSFYVIAQHCDSITLKVNFHKEIQWVQKQDHNVHKAAAILYWDCLTVLLFIAWTIIRTIAMWIYVSVYHVQLWINASSPNLLSFHDINNW